MNRRDTNILITLTPLNDGDPDLVVDFGDEKRPTYNSYRWASETFKSEHLYITKSDFGKTDSMEGIYIIGVIGYSDTLYHLTVLFESEKIADIMAGVDYEFTV